MNFAPRVSDAEDYPRRSGLPIAWEASKASFAVASVRADKAKRVMDAILTLLSLPVALLLALPITFLIVVQGGSPFYRHLRVGRNGRPFYCYKFRTMTPDADARLARLLREDPEARREWFDNFKLRDDPRATRLGRLLRDTCLDEIPQILNVIRGEMSWVGPRPIISDELGMYGENLPAYLACRPGLTGLWQVSRRRETSYAQRIALDVQYAMTWSAWLDLRIILKTVPRIIAAKAGH